MSKFTGGSALHYVDSFILRGEEDNEWHEENDELRQSTDIDDRVSLANRRAGADLEANRSNSNEERTLHESETAPQAGDPEKQALQQRRKDPTSADQGVQTSANNTIRDRSKSNNLNRMKSELLPPEERKWKDDVIVWDSKDDPANPKNWSFLRRYTIVAALGALTMCSTFASSIFSSASEAVGAEYGVGSQVMVLGQSLFVLGFLPGPILFAPLSELYGRKIVLIPVFIFACFSAATATAENIQTIFITRFFAGMFASAPVTTVGGSLADMFDQRERGTAVVFYSLAVVAGPTLGPVCGAALTEVSWRWTEYVVVILIATVLILAIFIVRVPETYAPVILTNKARDLRLKTNRWELHSRHEMNDFSLGVFLNKTLTLPLRLIAFEPMVLCITVYNSFAYGILYMLFAAVPIVFREEKGWTPVQAALPFLGVLIGTLGAAATNFTYSVVFFGPYLDKHGGSAKPEMRLPPMMLGGILFPAGFFLLGWAPSAGQVIGLVFIGASFLLIFQSGINYLIDAYTIHSASAVAANTFMRSIFAVGLPFAASPLFHHLGTGPACSLLGGVACILGLVPFAFFWFGENLRKRSKFAKKDQSAGMAKAV